jgi:hypothetical protein
LHSGIDFSSAKLARCTAFSSSLICLVFKVRNKFNFSSSRLTIELNVGILNSLIKQKRLYEQIQTLKLKFD